MKINEKILEEWDDEKCLRTLERIALCN